MIPCRYILRFGGLAFMGSKGVGIPYDDKWVYGDTVHIVDIRIGFSFGLLLWYSRVGPGTKHTTLIPRSICRSPCFFLLCIPSCWSLGFDGLFYAVVVMVVVFDAQGACIGRVVLLMQIVLWGRGHKSTFPTFLNRDRIHKFNCLANSDRRVPGLLHPPPPGLDSEIPAEWILT